jgi:hypothetical protein
VLGRHVNDEVWGLNIPARNKAVRSGLSQEPPACMGGQALDVPESHGFSFVHTGRRFPALLPGVCNIRIIYSVGSGG